MAPRRKSRLQRLLSFNQHRKRWGAARHAEPAPDLTAMKARIIDLGTPQQTRGSEKALDQHLENLRREFSGQSELFWHHARLIVLIRREYRPAETYAQFRALWDAEAEYLCENLNIRWLVSATDTFADHDPEPQVRAVAMMASLLTNVVKIHESERHVSHAADLAPDPARIERLQSQLVPLFEGMSVFTVGTDDTLRNMYWRLEPFFGIGPVGPILRTIWDRFQVEDTVFARLRELHRRDRTGWWRDES